MMAPAKKKLRVRKKEKASAKSSQLQPLRPETSPDSKCPICLDRFVNVASVERCLHRFCFRCIREWAKNKAECPLCKQPFRSIFHSVKAKDDFKEYVVFEGNAQSATTSSSATVTMTAAAIAVPPAGQNDVDSTVTRTRRSRATRARQRRSQRAQDSAPSATSEDGVSLDHTTLMQRDPSSLRQLLPWLRRERVMGTNPSELRPFLLARTDHILHELMNFARSIEAMQGHPAPSYEEDSSTPSSIINILEDDSEDVDVTENTAQDRLSPMIPWDDETPGPSYFTLGHPQTEEVECAGNQSEGSVTAPDQREHKDEEDECMIVGYVKPMAERTPELVQLSSDSTEEDEAGNESVATETAMKAELLLSSDAQVSPKPCPSTSHTEGRENPEHSREQDADKHMHHVGKDHAPRNNFQKPLDTLSGSLSRTSSESSMPSGRSVRIDRTRMRCREPRRRGLQLLGQSSSLFSERDTTSSLSSSSSPDYIPPLSFSTRVKLSKPYAPGYDGKRKKKRKKKKRRGERETERSRSPRCRHGDRELRPCSRSSSSGGNSDVDSRREKPAGKRKYKTRHLERTARQQSCAKSKERERERERSPSVEIVFERRAADAHSRGRRRKNRARRREREQTSPTIITIDSDSNSGNRHTAQANTRTVDYQLTDDNDVPRDGAADDRVTDDVSDHTIDYQERLAELSDCTADYKDDGTDARTNTNQVMVKDHVSNVSGQVSASITQVSEYTSGLEMVTDQTTELEDNSEGVSDHTKVNGSNMIESPDDLPGDSQGSGPDLRVRAEPSVLDMLNLGNCLVDRSGDEDSLSAATLLSDPRLLELEDSLLEEGQEIMQNSNMDQSGAGLVAHRDQSQVEAEMEHTDMMRNSHIIAELSPDL